MLAALFTSQSCPAQAVPKSSLSISEKTSAVTVICGFIWVVSRIFEVTVMGERNIKLLFKCQHCSNTLKTIDTASYKSSIAGLAGIHKMH